MGDEPRSLEPLNEKQLEQLARGFVAFYKASQELDRIKREQHPGLAARIGRVLYSRVTYFG